ncbi:hypothetical protein QZH41_003745 [Actinostola sp. cb2023]|nr:hypothetical protein QZH41_003745 [Actinostola sp. cb2023]
MCQLHDVALNRYIMDLTDTFKAHSTQNAQGKEAAFCHGRNKDVWVLNDKIQIDSFGNQLDETDFVWLGNFMARDCIVPNKYASEISMPLADNALPKVFKALEKCLGTRNFVSAFLYIASGVMLSHYEYNLDQYQQCPTPLAVGPKGTGKTTTSKVFLSIVGLQRIARNPHFHTYMTILTTLRKEASRVVIIPFPRIEEANPLSEQLQHEDRLKRKCLHASKAIGCILGIPQNIDAELQRSAIKMVESKVRQYFNPAVRCSSTSEDAMGYAISKRDGMALLGMGKDMILFAIKNGKLGDTDVNREFVAGEAGTRKKLKKKKACTFRRTAIDKAQRERLDKGSQNTAWLATDGMIIAEGQLTAGYLEVRYSSTANIPTGCKVMIDDNVFTVCRFPFGTKVTFQIYNPDELVSGASDSENGESADEGDKDGDGHDDDGDGDSVEVDGDSADVDGDSADVDGDSDDKDGDGHDDDEDGDSVEVDGDSADVDGDSADVDGDSAEVDGDSDEKDGDCHEDDEDGDSADVDGDSDDKDGDGHDDDEDGDGHDDDKDDEHDEKLEDRKISVQTRKRRDIMIVTETWLKGDDSDARTIADISNTLAGYKVVHLPRVLKNYRPISNLPFLGKVIERIVAMQLKHYLVTNDLYTITQSAYRANHSTETAMLRVSNDINLALDNHNDVVLVMLDLSSAFDTIDHKELRYSLRNKTWVLKGRPIILKKANRRVIFERDTEEQRHRGTETQRNRDTAKKRHRGTEEQRHRGTETQRNRDTETQRNRGTETQRNTERHRGTETQRNRDTEDQRHRGTETQRNRDTEEQRHRGTEIQRNRDTEEQRHRGTETQRNRDTEDQRHRGTETQRNRGTETQRNRDTEEQRHRGTVLITNNNK